MKKLAVLCLPALFLLPACDGSSPTDPQDFTVEGQIALSSLMSLSDNHLVHISNFFRMAATADAIRTANWERIGPILDAADDLKVRSLMWFALADGSYWSVQHGREAGNLSDQPYWASLMAGERVVGRLVISLATGRPSAIVAEPVYGFDGDIVGVLGASVYLDSLSEQLRRELDLRPHQIFFAIDDTPIAAVQHDLQQIFVDPFDLDEPDLHRAIQEMLSREEGVVNYRFQGQRRTVLYRWSPVTGWWYAFGRVWD